MRCANVSLTATSMEADVSAQSHMDTSTLRIVALINRDAVARETNQARLGVLLDYQRDLAMECRVRGLVIDPAGGK